MSNELAIATVTAALGRSLSNAFAEDNLGFAATVTNVRPNAADTALPAAGANIFLFLVTPNAAHRNSDIPTRRADQTLLRPPTVALDLHYLISFYGDDAQLEPQILLGSAVRALHENPVLTSEVIAEMLAENRFNFLGTSDLASAPEPVRFTPSAMSLEDLSKLWSVVFQTPYVLSVVYQAGVILIRRDEPVAATQPVRFLPNVLATSVSNPVIKGVVPAVVSPAGIDLTPAQPILATGTIAVTGRGLAQTGTRFQIDGAPAAALQSTDALVALKLDPALPAGTRAIQAVRDVDFRFPPEEPGRAGGASVPRSAVVASNIATFVLTPQVTQATPTPTGATTTGIQVTVTPAVGQEQRLRLLLNQTDAAAGQVPLSYSIAVAARETQSTSDTPISIPVSGITPATYQVRVEVDGAQSAVPSDPTPSRVKVQ